MRYSPGVKSLIVNGVTPLGLPLIVTAAPAGRESIESPPVVVAAVVGGAGGLPIVAGVLGRGIAVAAADRRTSSERDGRARVICTFRVSVMNPRRAIVTSRVPTSRSRSANGVTPLAMPSTDTLAPLGVDLTNRRPTLAAALDAAGAGVVADALGAFCGVGALGTRGAGTAGAGSAPFATGTLWAGPGAAAGDSFLGALAIVSGVPECNALGRAI